MNDLQKCQFEMLKVFVKFCEEHKLQYYLVGGTALGAIRHKGFIPWDDDIDVGMPRKDYEEYLKLAEEEYNKKEGSPYFIQTWKTDPNYPYNFAKLRDNRTTFVEDNFMFVRMNQGVWIDIFPLDGLTKNETVKKSDLRRIHNTWFGFWAIYPKCMIHKIRAKHWWKDFWQNVFGVLFGWWNIKHCINKRVDKVMKKVPFEESVWMANIQGAVKARAVRTEYFQEGVAVKFEGVDMLVPKEYDKYLTAIYGDYMTPPPADKQIGMHFHKGLDLNTPYYEWKKDYRKW